MPATMPRNIVFNPNRLIRRLDMMDQISFPRRRTRHSVRIDADVCRADGTTLSVPVSDLSLDGCCLHLELPIGERLTITLPRIGVLQGQVRWSFVGRSGLKFDPDSD